MKSAQQTVDDTVLNDPNSPNKRMTEVDIEDLVRWTYSKQKADSVSRAAGSMTNAELALFGYATVSSSACGCATLERISRLGTQVDGGGYASARLHHDAEVVHAEVEKLCVSDRLLVRYHAKTDTVPDWLPDATVRLVPVVNGKGKPKMLRDPKRHRATACLVEPQTDPEFIRFAREQYSEWWHCMAYLMDVLRTGGLLKTFYPTEFKRKESPWN